MTDTPKAAPTAKRRPWGSWLVAVLSLLIVGLVFWYVLVLPAYVESRVNQAMQTIGLPDAEAHVAAVTTDTLVLRNVQTGGLRIPAMTVSYSLSQLRVREVQSVEIYGASYPVTLTRDGLDLGPLVDWFRKQPPRDAPLPFDKLSLEACQLIVRFGEWTWPIPISGEMKRDGTLNIRADLPGATTTITDDAAELDAGSAIHAKVTWDGDAVALEALRITAAGVRAGALGEWSTRIAVNGEYRDGTLTLRLDGDNHVTLSETGRLNLRPLGDAPLLAWGGGQREWALQVAGAQPIDFAFAGVAVEQFQAALPIASTATAAGEWSIGRISIDGMQVNDLAGTASLIGSDLAFALDAADASAGAGFRASFDRRQRQITMSFTGPPPQVLSQLGMRFRDDADLDARATLTLRDGGVDIDNLRLAATGITLIGDDHWAADIALHGGYRDGVFTLNLKDDAHLRAGAYGRINLRPLGDDALLTIDGNGPRWALEAATAGPIDLDVGDVKLKQFNATLPITSASRAAGLWSVGEVDAAGLNVTNLAGTAALRGTHLAFEVDPFAIDDAVGEWTFAGKVDADGDIPLLGGEPRVTIQLTDTDVTSEPQGLAAEGVTGSLTLNSFSPLATQGGQRIAAERVAFNKLALTDGYVVFRLEGRQSLLIEKTHWRFDEVGRLWAHGFRVNPQVVAFETQLFVQDMPLMKWLNVLSDGKIKGEGRFHGRIPLDYNAARKQRIALGEGYLYTNPGPGRFSVADTKMVNNLLADSGVDFAADSKMQTLKRNLIEAFSDFQYSQLTLDFIPESQGMLTRIHLAGQGRTGTKQEVGGLTLNIRGLDQVINSLLLLKSGSEGGLQDALRNLIEPTPRAREPKP